MRIQMLCLATALEETWHGYRKLIFQELPTPPTVQVKGVPLPEGCDIVTQMRATLLSCDGNSLHYLADRIRETALESYEELEAWVVKFFEADLEEQKFVAKLEARKKAQKDQEAMPPAIAN